MFLQVLTVAAIIFDMVGVVHTLKKGYFIQVQENVVNESYLLKHFKSS